MVQPRVRASIRMLSSGRRLPIVAGYRPQMHIEGDKGDWCMGIAEVEPEPLAPGEEGSIGFDLVSWDKLRHRLYVGMEFKMREGYKVVAECIVTAISSE